MKKIVALVLAMVMVLGLATTAFAAMGGKTFDAAKVDAGWDYVVELDDPEDAKDETFATYEIEAIAKKDIKGSTAFWFATATDVEKDDDFELGTYVKVGSEDDADFVLIEGKVVTYFKKVASLEWETTAVKVVLPGYPADKGDVKCNTLYNDKAKVGVPGTFYYDAAEEQMYKAVKAGSVVLNVGGVAVYAEKVAAGDTYESGHSVIVNYANRYTAQQYPTKAYCELCKTEFKFIYGFEKDAMAEFGPYGYFPADVNNAGFGTYIEAYYPAVPGVTGGSAVVTPDADNTVESPKTFDAGIAMYVGMSIMAAAGSAVVLKKKD